MNSIPSINCAILGEPLRRYVADPALLSVLERILDASPLDCGVLLEQILAGVVFQRI